MYYLITYLTIFILFCFLGWCLEVVYRSSKEHHLVNPGFMVGCTLPIYGVGASTLYLISDIKFGIDNQIAELIIKIVLCAILMTLVEYIAGIISLKVYHNRLWDYSNRFLNIQGFICPRFSFYWAVLGGLFIGLCYKHLKNFTLYVYDTKELWLILGVLYGVFIVDLIYSLKLMQKIKAYAEKFHVSFNFEQVKINIRTKFSKLNEKRISSWNEFKIRHKLSQTFDDKNEEDLNKLTDNSNNK